ncbi:2OG-Fe(II) oxygenase family protein [Streptomyces sp. N50]|uniref:2OG-Fe(II) oxygenase family protein n=1 Tax=Streptomyces sp. N50 TaxID=3081765 RepID=UPI002961F628|nr:2OG-Fe(II) oxygenase family protein [Streptomyces sp. N50]WOX15316.1 2OG-Fe(II) oxygenase family protein [Streptomyces sp. N50]
MTPRPESPAGLAGPSQTVRAAVRLPAMPGEHEAARTYPPIALERARLDGERLVFDRPTGFDQALQQGFFLLRVPNAVDTAPGDLFAAHFHEPAAGDAQDVYRGYRDIQVPGDYQGYFDREHDQWENFYIETANFALLPDSVTRLGQELSRLGIHVLRAVLDHVGIPRREWAKVTGGLTEHHGHRMLAFNHFRPDKPVRGSKFHRDSGWVTVLRSTEPGLLALIDGDLHAINPEPGYFAVNFGSSFEVLTERLPHPVRANVHGVARTERQPGQPHRTSYVIFLDSDLAGTIYRYQDGEPQAVQSVADFAVQEVSRTYDDNSEL